MRSDFDGAVACAVASLARSEKFSSEIRGLLVKKGFDEETTERAIRHLSGRNVLDDLRCAQLAAARMNAKGSLGRARIEVALQSRGAAPEVIAAVLPPEPDSALLIELLRKRFPNGAEFPRAVRYLYSRGFQEELSVAAAECFVGRTDE